MCVCFPKGLIARSQILLELYTQALTAYVSSQKWEGRGRKWETLSPCGHCLHSPPSRVDSSASSGVCFVFRPEDLVAVSRRQAVMDSIPLGQNQNSHFLFSDLNK